MFIFLTGCEYTDIQETTVGLDATARIVSKQHTEGKDVTCEMSITRYQSWTPDAFDFYETDIGFLIEDVYPNEWYLNISSYDVLVIMKKRIHNFYKIKCDSISLLDTDYNKNDGFFNTKQDLDEYYDRLVTEIKYYRMDLK